MISFHPCSILFLAAISSCFFIFLPVLGGDMSVGIYLYVFLPFPFLTFDSSSTLCYRLSRRANRLRSHLPLLAHQPRPYPPPQPSLKFANLVRHLMTLPRRKVLLQEQNEKLRNSYVALRSQTARPPASQRQQKPPPRLQRNLVQDLPKMRPSLHRAVRLQQLQLESLRLLLLPNLRLQDPSPIS